MEVVKLTNLDKAARWNRASHVKDDENLVKLNTEEKLEYEPDLSNDALLRNEFFLKVITDAIKEETDLSARYLTE